MKVANLVTAVVLAVAAGAATAGDWYATGSVDQKVKQNSSTGEYHNVYGLTVGTKLGSGFSAEYLVENEQVEHSSTGQAHEGLFQARINKAFETGTLVTPYVGVAVGRKNKATIDFPYYRADIGTNINLGDSLVAKVNYRHRQAFDATLSDGTATKYNTNEARVSLIYKLTKADAITVSYAQERRADTVSSEYNTTAVAYTRSF